MRKNAANTFDPQIKQMYAEIEKEDAAREAAKK